MQICCKIPGTLPVDTNQSHKIHAKLETADFNLNSEMNYDFLHYKSSVFRGIL